MGWQEVEYEVAPADDPWISAVTQTLNGLYANGGVILRVFRPTDDTAFDAAKRADLKGFDYMVRCFLEAPSVRAAVPELLIPDQLPKTLKHYWYGGFEFEGAITHLLLTGGAYGQRSITEAAARRMSRRFVDALVGKRLEVSVCQIGGAWTDWFFDIAWDYTFVILNLRSRRWGLICVTDTD